MKECWVKIEFLKGEYFISNLGRAMSRKNGTYKILKTPNNGRGYPSLSCQRKTYPVHKLVAESFLPKIIGKTEINHKDGDKLNNTLKNLEWATRSENMKHAHRMGLSKFNEEAKSKSLYLTSKPVLCKYTGIYYKTILEASFASGQDRKTLSKGVRLGTHDRFCLI